MKSPTRAGGVRPVERYLSVLQGVQDALRRGRGCKTKVPCGLVSLRWTRRSTVCSAFARWRQAHHHCWGSGHGPHLGRERRSMLCIRTLATGAPASLLVPGTGHISGESECEERAVTNTFLSEVFRPLPTLTVRLHVRPADHNPHCMTVLTRYRHIVHVLLSCA